MAEIKNETWTDVDRYFAGQLLPADPVLDAALAANVATGLPPIDVTPLQGRFLELLVRISGARRILEIGTLGAYSTLWLARALPPDGRIVTLELDPHHADVARANLQRANLQRAGLLDRAGLLNRIDLRVGPASESLKNLIAEATPPFDFIFIDADKSGYPEYLELSLQLARPGTVILADNVVRDGNVIDPDSTDPNIQGVRRFTQLVAAEPRLSATVLQTVAAKGYDGFALAVVLR